MGAVRCCEICGRWGNRAFYEIRDKEWACTNDAACKRRAIARGYLLKDRLAPHN